MDFEDIVSWGLGLVIFIIFLFMLITLGDIGYSIHQDEMRPTFELKKDDWKCTKHHQEVRCIKGCFEHTVCDQWSAK